jgi:CheY-like chemotaxis protein
MEPRDFPILLVEDNEDDVLFVRRAFAKARIVNPLMVVDNGDDAVAYLSGERNYTDRQKYPLPMLILLDWKLPRLSGNEVLLWLKEQPDMKKIPVVVLTSSRESEDVNQAYELGASTYLAKPVSFDGLVEMVQNLRTYWMIMAELPQVSPA